VIWVSGFCFGAIVTIHVLEAASGSSGVGTMTSDSIRSRPIQTARRGSIAARGFPRLVELVPPRCLHQDETRQEEHDQENEAGQGLRHLELARCITSPAVRSGVDAVKRGDARDDAVDQRRISSVRRPLKVPA
jgi:hypothetical protein